MQAKFNGQKVRTLRKMKKLSQAMLAEQGDTSERYIRDLERGQKRNPSASVVCSLWSSFCFPPAWGATVLSAWPRCWMPRRENAALRWCRMFPHRNLLSRGWPGGAQKNSLSRSTSKM